METACCGVSVRSAALLLLCANLIFNMWELWSEVIVSKDDSKVVKAEDSKIVKPEDSKIIKPEDQTYKQFLKDNSTFVYMDSCLLVVGALVFLAAIIVIKMKMKLSIALLTAAVLVSLFDVFFLLYGMILLNPDNGGMGKLLHINSNTVFIVYGLLLATMVFKFYSALVFHNCKVELKENSLYGAPTQYTFVEKEVSTSGPPAYGENFQYAAPLLKFALYLTQCLH